MASQGEASWNGQPVNDIEIQIDLDVLADKLAKDPKFIRLIANKVRKEQTREVRSTGNVFGKWAGR